MHQTSPAICIAKQKQDPNLSKTQKQFNKLIKQIENERSKLLAWKDVMPSYQQKYSAQYFPLLIRYEKLSADLVRLFDNALENKGFNKLERSKMRDYICSTLEQLIDEHDKNNLKDIYNKYTGGDFDEELEDEKQALKSMFKDELGLDLGDDFDVNSPEQVLAQLAEQMQQKQETYQQRRAQRKKSAKMLAHEQKIKEEELKLSQSIKEVYRKLAAQLHPDKEQNLVERDRKTALMQRVNEAYEKGDLLQLLELQLETEQIDQKMLNIMSIERLKIYNRVFSEQLMTLKQEVNDIQFGFKVRFNINSEFLLRPEFLMKELQQDIEDMQDKVASMTNDLELLHDKKALKTWLKSYEIFPKFDGWIFEY